jgi:hypothetical protein
MLSRASVRGPHATAMIAAATAMISALIRCAW